MNYLHGQILVFSLRALYRFGLGMTGETDQFSKDRKENFEIMHRHIEFLQDCIEHLPTKED